MRLHQALLSACEGHITGRHRALGPACLLLFGLPGVKIDLNQVIHETLAPRRQENAILTRQMVQGPFYQALASSFRGLIPPKEQSGQLKCLEASHDCESCTKRRGCHWHNYMAPSYIGMCSLYEALNESEKDLFKPLWESCNTGEYPGDNPLLYAPEPLYDYPLCILDESTLSKAIYLAPLSVVEGAFPIGQSLGRSNDCDKATKWGINYQRTPQDSFERERLLASLGIYVPPAPPAPPPRKGISAAVWIVISASIVLSILLLAGGACWYYPYRQKARLMDIEAA